MTLFLLDHRIYWLAGFGGRKGDKSDLARTDRYSHTSLDIAYVTPCMLFLHVSPSVDLHYLYNPAHILSTAPALDWQLILLILRLEVLRLFFFQMHRFIEVFHPFSC